MEPINAWPVIRRTRVAEAVQEPPAAPSITGGSFLEGWDGMARYAWVRLSVLWHLACHAEMVSCLDERRLCSVLSGWGGREWWLRRGRGRCLMPAIETSVGHHLMMTRVFLNTERI